MTEPRGFVRLSRRPARSRVRLGAFALITSFILIGIPNTGSAQLVRLDEAKTLGSCGESGCSPTTSLLDADYDPANQLLLVLSRTGPHPQPIVDSLFVNTSGVVSTEAALWGPLFSGFSLAYSGEVNNAAGGFLVAEGTGRLRIVTHPAGLLTDGAFDFGGTVYDVAYSPVSREFLLVSGSPLRVSRAGLDAQPLGPSVQVGPVGLTYTAQVVWNPVSNEFGIA